MSPAGSFVEKVPLLLIATVAIVLTLHAQKGVGALSDTIRLPLDLRVKNALVAYVLYLVGFFLPHDLAVLYPYPVSIPVGDAVSAALLMLAITAALFFARKKAPYALMGWLWFAGTLVPVIGIVQVGSQSMADRYTYVAHIGLSIAVVWACAEIVRRWRIGAKAVAAACAAVAIVLSAITWTQVGYWSDGTRLFRHALAVTERNFIAQNNYGVEALGMGQLDEAATSFETAVEWNPGYATGWYNLGVAYKKKAQFDKAAEALTRSLAIAPNDPRTELNLAMVLAVQKKYVESFPHYETSLRLAPQEPEVHLSYANALNNYGAAMGQSGKQEDAMALFERALQIDPGNASAKKNIEYTKGVMAASGQSAAAPAR